MKPLGPGRDGRPGRFDGGRRAIRQPPGSGLRHESRGCGDRAAGRKGHGHRSGGCDRSGAEQRVPRRECRLEGRRPGASRCRRTLRRDGDVGARPSSTGRVARPANREDCPLRPGAGAAAHRPLPAVERQHRRRLDAVAPRELRLRVLRRPARRRQSGRDQTEVRCAHPCGREHAIDPRRIPDGIGAAAVSGRDWRRRRSSDRSVRQGRWHARLPERQQQLRHRAAEAAGEERGDGAPPATVFCERLAPAGHGRSGAPAHGRYAGTGDGLLRRQPHLPAARGLLRRACSRSIRPRGRRCSRAI